MTLISENLELGLVQPGAELQEESLIKKLMTSIKCASCGQAYELGNIDVLGHQEGLWFLKASCPACHSQALVAAVIEKSENPQIITELAESELDKFENMSPPTADDMLDMHDFLKDFDGDFFRLFRR